MRISSVGSQIRPVALISKFRRYIRAIAITMLALVVSGAVQSARAEAQGELEIEKSQADSLTVDEIFDNMTDQEKVGQLFIATFTGNELSVEVRELINEYKIGGLYVDSSTRNFSNRDTKSAALQVAELTNALQAYAATVNTKTHEGETYNLPLLMVADHEGNGPNLMRIRHGMTIVPGQLAIGATWRPELAEEVGTIVGRELAAVGINMLFGPVVDVVDEPLRNDQGNMSYRSFGGDPHWVGRMGEAYIQGVHLGSGGRVATVAKHFPGHGDSNRNPDYGPLPSVSKTIEELRRVDLIPFFNVMRSDASDGFGVTDAIMSSHIEFEEGGPVSLSRGAVSSLLDQQEFESWREHGVVVVDALGVPAVTKSSKYRKSANGTSFADLVVPYDALMAGNDILTLSPHSIYTYERTKRAWWYMLNLYSEDGDARQRIDAAVRKIVGLKMRLYGQLNLHSIQVDTNSVEENVGGGENVVKRVGEHALTLIRPLNQASPSPPTKTEQMLIVTHNWLARACYDCRSAEPWEVDAIEKHFVRLNQHDEDRIESIPMFAGEAEMEFSRYVDKMGLDSGSSVNSEQDLRLNALIDGADWIIFALLDQDIGAVGLEDPERGNQRESKILKSFLAEYKGSAKIVVIYFGSPSSSIDSTDVTKLDSLWAIYGKTEPFPELATLALLRRITARSHSPVDIERVDYNVRDKVRVADVSDFALTLTWGETSESVSLHSCVEGEAGETENQSTEVANIETAVLTDMKGHPSQGRLVNFDIVSGGSDDDCSVSATTRDGVAQVQIRIPQTREFFVQARVDSIRSMVVPWPGILEPTNFAPTAATVQPTSTVPIGVGDNGDTVVPIPGEEYWRGFVALASCLLLIGYVFRKAGFVGSGNCFSSVRDDGKGIVLFVHGFRGSCRTWGRLPEILAGHPGLSENWDVESIEYKTGMFRSVGVTRRVQKMAKLLESEIDARYDHYNRIVVVTHSLGGLVMRRLVSNVLDNETSEDGGRLDVAGLVFCAIPNSGSYMARLLGVLPFRSDVLDQLSTGSDLLEGLNRSWDRMFGRGLINFPIWSIVGEDEEVINYAIKPEWIAREHVVPGKDHSSLVKPAHENESIVKHLVSFLNSVSGGDG